MRIIKRIMVVFGLMVITYLGLYLLNNTRNTKIYKYITYEDEWGESFNCYKEDEYLMCRVEDKNVRVKQYYWEE